MPIYSSRRSLAKWKSEGTVALELDPARDPIAQWRADCHTHTAAMVDKAENGVRIVVIHERARPVVDGLARDGHVVRVHDAMDEAHAHPIRNERGLALYDRLEMTPT